uniref:MATH domain-containing protein n=1 Tax=Eutreptiella gymnastica TaxID=73025 RepID=A0A7S4FLF3_9EUGL
MPHAQLMVRLVQALEKDNRELKATVAELTGRVKELEQKQQGGKFTFTWKVTDFADKLEAKEGLYSNEMTIAGFRVFVELRFSDEHLGFYCRRHGECPKEGSPHICGTRLEVRSTKQSVHRTLECSDLSYEGQRRSLCRLRKGFGVGWPKMVRLSALNEEGSGFIEEDTLVVVGKIWINKSHILEAQ